MGRLGRLAVPLLALLLIGCAVPNLVSVAPASDPISRPSAARASASVGASLDKTAVASALDAAVAAGPARFQRTFGLTAEQAGYDQTVSRSEGVIDLSASRSVAVTKDYPGMALSAKREVALVGNRMFARPLPGGGTWDERSGGARSTRCRSR